MPDTGSRYGEPNGGSAPGAGDLSPWPEVEEPPTGPLRRRSVGTRRREGRLSDLQRSSDPSPDRRERVSALLTDFATATSEVRELTEAIAALRAELHASMAEVADTISGGQRQLLQMVNDALARSETNMADALSARLTAGTDDVAEVTDALLALQAETDAKLAALAATVKAAGESATKPAQKN